jgi:glycosyltransferase involved in cell wall biosynthesis
MKKLAIISTHAIQYNAPLFRKLSESGIFQVKVFYTWSQVRDGEKFDPGFGKHINWDIPLLEGYDYCFVENVSTKPGSDHSLGIMNPTLNKEVEEWKPDALLIYGWNFDSHLRLLKYFKGKVPIFFRGDSTLLDEKMGLSKLLRRRFLRGVYKYVDYAFYVGTNNYKYYKAIGLQEKQLIFAPHSVNDQQFADPNGFHLQKATEKRRLLGIPESSVVFLFAGKLEPKKNPRLLVEAFMAAASADDHLLIVGNGILENEVRQIAKGRANIHFLDFCNQSEMPALYRIADVLLLPSKGPSETWGLSINEAMICERAIIASNKVGCAVDLVKEGENGYIFRSEDCDDLQTKIRLFSGNKDLCRKFGKRSGEIIRNWSMDITAQKMLEGLSKTLAG